MVSSAACGGLASERVGSKGFALQILKENAKILKNFLITQMAALVVLNPNRFRLSNAAIKKAVRLVEYILNVT